MQEGANQPRIRFAFTKKCCLPYRGEVLWLFGSFSMPALKGATRTFQIGGETRVTDWAQGKGGLYVLYLENIAVIKAKGERYRL